MVDDSLTLSNLLANFEIENKNNSEINSLYLKSLNCYVQFNREYFLNGNIKKAKEHLIYGMTFLEKVSYVKNNLLFDISRIQEDNQILFHEILNSNQTILFSKLNYFKANLYFGAMNITVYELNFNSFVSNKKDDDIKKIIKYKKPKLNIIFSD